MTSSLRQTRSRVNARGAAAVVVCAALLLLALHSGATAVWPPWLAQDEGEPVYPDVTASVGDVRAKMGAHDVVLIDARPADDYERGHIPGAISFPMPGEHASGGIPVGDIPAVLGAAGLTGTAKYICYGERTYSDPAAYAFWLLEAGGAERVQLLDGGHEAWVASGGHVETAPRRLTPAVWTVAPVDSLLASLAYVVDHYGVSGHEIIDARSHAEWEGGSAGSEAAGRARGGEADAAGGDAARVGHIPHSLHCDFREMLEDGALLPADECREIFSLTGPRPASPVRLGDEFIVHGLGAEHGAMAYYLLRRAGLSDVRYYPGGWNRWRADETLPIVRFVSGVELKEMVARANRWPWQDQPDPTFVFIDVRHEYDHANGHIPGSVVLTSRLFADSLDVVLARHWPEVDRATTPVVTYCYGPTCIRSRYTSTAAARAGFLRVWRFYGGLEEWREVGGRIAK